MSVLAAPPAGSALRPIPGDGGLPWLGHTIQTLRDPLGLAARRIDRFGDIYWGRLLGKTVVSAHGPDAMEAILTNKDKAFANGPAWSFFIGPFFHRGIMLLDFDEHLHHRRIMQQAFNKPRLRSYLDAMAPGITRGVEEWRPGRDFKVYDHMKQLTLDL